MARKCKAVKLVGNGFLTDEAGTPIICPLRNGNCNIRCSWFSVKGKVFYCRDIVIGAVRPGAVQSFRVHSGLKVYDLEQLLTNYDLYNPNASLAEESEDSLGAAVPEETGGVTSRADGYMNEERIER